MRAFTLMLFLFLSPPSWASMEGILPLATIHLESSGIDNSGPVQITGKATAGRIEELRVRAFGKEFVLPEEQLRGLENIATNGVQLSYERGYESLGGRTIYLVFSKGFTSGLKQTVRVTITERGEISVLNGSAK